MNANINNAFDNIVIRASAGTGKTFQLSNRFLHLLLADQPVEEILATTFTRKAAGEILDRVASRLAAAALDDAAAMKLATELGVEDLTAERCQLLLAALTRNLHRLRISTLDSFFAQLAGSFSLELRLPPGWRIADELEEAAFRDQAIERLLHDATSGDISRLVNLMTKGHADRSISELIRATVSNLHAVYLATEPEAWQRFPSHPKLTDPQLQDTIDALRSCDLGGDKRMVTARESDLEKAEVRDWEGFLAAGLAKGVLEGGNKYYRAEIPAAAVELYRRLIAHARGLLVEQLKNQTQASYDLLAHYDGLYRQAKEAAGILGFADITRTLAEAVRSGARLDDVGQMSFRLDARVAHLLLDEFQDTSLDQWTILRPFARRVVERGSAGSRSRVTSDPKSDPKSHDFGYKLAQDCSFFCVGDVKQAIYGWRGGVAEIFDAIEDELTGLSHDSLSKSFRSSQPVIDTVNQVFANLTQHPNLGRCQDAAAAWQSQFQQHSTAKAHLPGCVGLSTAPAADEGESQNDTVLEHAADRIAELVARAPAASIGVLVQRHATLARLIYELRQRGVDASEEGGNPLTDSTAVQLVLSLLRLSDHPGHTIARVHVARSPLGALVGLTVHDDEVAAGQIAAQLRRRLQTEGYGPVVLSLADQLAPFCDRRDDSRLQQLVEMAFNFQTVATLRARDFVRHVESTRVADPKPANVRVMTVFQAKGLQFDIVVLPELDNRLVGQNDPVVISQPKPTEPIDRVCLYRNQSIQNLLPPEMQQMFEKATHDAVTESLCVLYVALTRAVHALYMFIAPTKSKSIPATFAGVLRSTLAPNEPAAPETPLYAHGDEMWYSRDGAPQIAAAPKSALKSATKELPLSIQLAPSTAGPASDETISPSRLAGGKKRKAAEVLNLDSAAAQNRGTLVHAWFEQIHWLDDGLPERSALLEVANRHATTGLDVERLLDDFFAALQKPAIAAALCRSTFESPADNGLVQRIERSAHTGPLEVKALNEHRFATLDENGNLVSGSIDRLVLIHRGGKLVAADVLDFKTNAVEPDDAKKLAELTEHYRPQMEAYRSAVAKMFQLPANQIVPRLLFVAAGAVREIPLSNF